MLKLSYGKGFVVVCGLITFSVFAAEPRVDYDAFTLPTDLKPEIIISEDGIFPSESIETAPILVEQESTPEVVEPIVEAEIVEETITEVVNEQAVEQAVVTEVIETEIAVTEESISEPVVEVEIKEDEVAIVTPEIIIETEEVSTITESVEVASTVSGQQEQDVDEDLIILNWATAWSNNDTEGYLSFYADSFVPANPALDRASWEAIRRKRLGNQDIRIVVSNAALYRAEKDNIEVRFTQRYTSKNYRDRVIKSIEMIRTDGGWKFVSEKVVEKLAFE